jgi:hypothetical protein
MHSVWGVSLCISSPKTSKYLQRLRNNGEFWTKLRFSRLWAGFEVESGMHSIWRVELSKGNPETSKHLQRLRNNRKFRSILRFPLLWEGFYAENATHSVWRVNLCKSCRKTSKYLQRFRIWAGFGENWDFLCYGKVSTLKALCTAFGV